MGLIKFCYLKWILAIRLKLCQFITADFQKLIQILILLFCHFCASLNITLDFQHFVLHDTGWQLYFYNITCVCAHKSLSYRRFVRNLAFQAVCLCGANQLQFYIFVKLEVMYSYFTSYADLVKIDFVLNYNLSVLQDFLNFFNTRFDISLLIFSCIVLCILGQVSLLSCLFDLTCYFFSFYYL